MHRATQKACRSDSGPAAPPWRPREFQRSLLLSLAVHVLALAAGSTWRAAVAAPDRHPVAFAVERSLLSHEASPAAGPPLPETPPVIVEVPREATPLAELLEPPPEPFVSAVPAPEPPVEFARDEERLRRNARTSLQPPAAEPEEPVLARLEPVRPIVADATAAQVARPEVPVPIPGHNPHPDYPPYARRRNIEGTVLVRIDVDADGAALRCTLVAGSGCTSLDLAALTAAKRWRFAHGPGAVEVPFVFQIRG